MKPSPGVVEQMTVVGWNAAMHAASVMGQPEKALKFLDLAKVGKLERNMVRNTMSIQEVKED